MQKSVFHARRVIFGLLVSGVLLGVFAVSGGIFGHKADAVAGINQQFNFQGRLLNSQGVAVPDGNYNIQFKIYQDGTGTAAGNPTGTLKWTESRLNSASQGVQVKNGYMSVNLGSVNPFGTQVDWNQDTLWLSINIGNTNASCTPFTSCGGDGEMLPMKRLSSTPYALNAGMLEGKKASDFLQIAQGLQTDVSTNTASIYINKTSTGNFLQYQQNGAEAFAVTNAGDISFGPNADHSITIQNSAGGTAGKALTVAGGNAGTSGVAAKGGDLLLQGGNAGGTGNANGGDITLAGGAGVGTGVSGIVKVSSAAFNAGTLAACATSCTITQNLIDSYGTVIISSSGTDIDITLPAPTNTTAGRLVYITTPNVSNQFTLMANSGADALSVTMRSNTTATMIWNGTAWTPGGASNAITLQATYNNGANPSTTPEIKLDNIRGTIDIQDADTSIGSDILNVRGSNASGLGTVLFGVSSTGRVTIQGTTDQSSAFRVLNASGDYLYNINSSNNYVISNSTLSSGNEIANPGFEAGGNVTGGEEGWSGPSQGTFVNDANARTGNYSLRAIAIGSDQDYFAGGYREVTVGEEYTFSGYIKASAANGSAGIQTTWYDKDKNVLSYSTDYTTGTPSSYVQRIVKATAPANAVYARFSATVRSSANSGSYYFDDFTLQKTSQSSPYTFKNASDSSTAFRIQSASAAQTLFTANTSNNTIKIGDNTGSDTATTLLVVDSTTVDPTTITGKDGGMFYNSSTNSLKAVIGGSVVDICTTAVTCSGYSASAGSTIQLQATSPGSQQIGNFNISGTGILTKLQTQDSTTGSSSTLTIKSGNASGTGTSGNLVLDVGTGGSGPGTIQIGHSGVSTTMAGNLTIQGSSALTLGVSNTTDGAIVFNSATTGYGVTLKAASNATESYSLTLPGAQGAGGYCMKNNGAGALFFEDCSAGSTTTLQSVYNNSAPSTINLSDNTSGNKDFKIVAQNTAVDPNILFDLECSGTCTSGRFAVQNSGTDVFTVQPNNGGITMNAKVQIGSASTDGTIRLLQLDSYNGSETAEATATGGCSTATNQGALYYNTTMGSLRGCMGSSGWVDVSNPDTLGLLTFGVIPSSGGPTNAYDLPSLSNSGGVYGPCKVSWASATSVQIQPCIAYSGGRRVTVGSNTSPVTISTASMGNSQWAHVCLSGTNGAPVLTTPSASATANLPTWDAASPVLCLADIQSTTGGAAQIHAIYDTRTFSSTLKEAVITNSAVELGMLVDSGTVGAMTPAVSNSKKLYGTVIVADSTRASSAGAPNAIVTTTGPAWVKAISGSAGAFVISSTTNGYATTNASIPNNSFYYSAGNTRTDFTAPTNTNTACSAATACGGSLYVNFNVR